MKRLRLFIISVVVLVFAGFVFAGGETADEALKKLMDGNQRYVTGNLAQKDLGDAKRQELAKGQKPFAIVVTCSDSRVAPELLFDQGLGDIFVVRVAGNVIDSIELGSIEYAAEHLHSPLIIVLGHEKCGAVTAALEAKGNPTGNIGSIVKKILPAAQEAKKKGGTKDEILEAAIKENVKNTAKDIIKKSKIIRHLSHKGEVKVVAGEYSLTTGKIEMIDYVQAGKKPQHEAHGDEAPQSH